MLLLNQTVHRLIDLALEEDIGPGDITTQTTIDPEIFAEAHIRAKEDLVVAGIPVAQAVFAHLDAEIIFAPRVDDGDLVKPKTVLAEVVGPAALLLLGERVALNFLMRLSGIATWTRRVRGRGAAASGSGRGHPQDHPGLAGAGKICRAGRRRRQPPLRPL